jgi:hypothetical protein
MTDSCVTEIRNMQGKLDVVLEEKKELEDNIKYLKLQLPRLHYLKMSGKNGYEKGVVIAGRCEDVYDYIEDHMENETTTFDDYNDLKGSRLNKMALVYPKSQSCGNAQPVGKQWYISGMVLICTPLDDIWQEVYELSLKVNP